MTRLKVCSSALTGLGIIVVLCLINLTVTARGVSAFSLDYADDDRYQGQGPITQPAILDATTEETTPTIPEETTPTIPEETTPTIPEETTPEETTPTTPEETTPTTPQETTPTTPQETTPTTPEETTPTTPQETTPTTPEETTPTTPEETTPTTPEETTPTTPQETTPTTPEETTPTTPEETTPTTPEETTPTTPEETTPTTPAETTPTTPEETTPGPSTPIPRPIPEDGTNILDYLERNQYVRYAFQLPQNGLILTLDISEGETTNYFSYKNPDPDNKDIKLEPNVPTFIPYSTEGPIFKDSIPRVYVGIKGVKKYNEFTLNVRHGRGEETTTTSSTVSLYISFSSLMLPIIFSMKNLYT